MGNKQVKEADHGSSSNPAPSSSVIESTEEDKVKAKIDASKRHWSELVSTRDQGDNAEAFESLRLKWPSVDGQNFFWECPSVGGSVVHGNPFPQKSFWNWHYDDLVYDTRKPIAAGSQAIIYGAKAMVDDELVLKVYKGGSLEDLQRLFPAGVLGDESTRSAGYFSGGMYCNPIYGATLLKDGKFAFVMARCWGDLRMLIDDRMAHNKGEGAPFTNDVAVRCMLEIAKGMQGLHRRNLPHRDLKAANVLIQKRSRYRKFDEIQDNDFICKVADFECSVGVIGTTFWRAPEILSGLQNRMTSVYISKELFTTKADVYSYAMTCYEVITGRIPFGEYLSNNYGVVLRGDRPELPGEVKPWMKDLLTKCWDGKPSNRPTFEEIVNVLDPLVPREV